MFNLIRKLWNDDCGALIATEWVFVATILIVGMVGGLKAVQSGVEGELTDLANGISGLNQSYSFGGSSGCCASSAGSFFVQTGRYSYGYSGSVAAPTLAPTGCP